MNNTTVHAPIFQNGCKDVSTKESRLSRELEELRKIRMKNPKKVVLNRRGKATPLKKAESSGAHGIQLLPPKYVFQRLTDLRQCGLMHNKNCKHSAKRVEEATRLVYGSSSYGSAQVATEYEVSPETVAAAYSGYYRVDGEMVFLHSDGSICRIPQAGATSTCTCNYFHG
jgi:hypothetical protein